MDKSLKQRRRAGSPYLAITLHPGGVQEVVDRVKADSGHVWSHLVIGPQAQVDAVCEGILLKHEDAYLVTWYGQGKDHMERVLHRPAQ